MRRPRRVAGPALFALILVMWMLGRIGSQGGDDGDLGIELTLLALGLIAAFLIAKRPDHRVSRIMAMAAVIGGVAALSAGLAPAEGTVPPIGMSEYLAFMVGGPAWVGFVFVVFVLLPLHFPTGSPPTRRWRWPGVLGGVAIGAYSVMWILQPDICLQHDRALDRCAAAAQNPIGLAGMPDSENPPLFLLFLAAGFGSMVSLIARYRRSEGVERLQIKWMAYVAVLWVGSALLIDTIWVDALGLPEPPGYGVVENLVWIAMPATVAVAILRYRLFDIDRIISRTISYVCVTSISLALFAILAVAPSRLLDSRDAPPALIAIATLTVAGLFTPLRRRVQAVVDRRFNRARYDAQLIADGFATRLRDPRELDVVTADLAGTVRSTMHPERLGMWVRP